LKEKATPDVSNIQELDTLTMLVLSSLYRKGGKHANELMPKTAAIK